MFNVAMRKLCGWLMDFLIESLELGIGGEEEGKEEKREGGEGEAAGEDSIKAS